MESKIYWTWDCPPQKKTPKKPVLSGVDTTDESKNHDVLTDLVQCLETEVYLLIDKLLFKRRNDSRKAFQILRAHYMGTGQLRIITLSTELTTSVKAIEESLTDYVIKAKMIANSLRSAGENMWCSLYDYCFKRVTPIFQNICNSSDIKCFAISSVLL